jgi:hypothetical protein
MPAAPKTDETTVVLVGRWNPAILTPPWLAQHVFGENAEQIPVEMELSSVAGQPPRFTMLGLRIMPAFDRLILSPHGLEDEQVAVCETRIRALLNTLPHTPISACGINFTFVDPEPVEPLLELFTDEEGLAERTGLEFETRSTSRARAIAMNGYVLNFTRSLSAENVVTYKFNFHYAVTNAAAAEELFNGGIQANLNVAHQIVAAYDSLGE